MKKIAALLTAACMIFSFASCAEESKKKENPAKETVVEDINYPEPRYENFAEFDSETGLRVDMNLEQYTDAFNEMYAETGGGYEAFPYKKWKKKSEMSQNGLDYVFYYLKKSTITLTATVEKESGYLINLGCGSSGEYFSKNEKTKKKVMKICAVMAAAAGGYSSENIDFFKQLFEEITQRKDKNLWYNNWIYYYEETNSTRFFRVMPASSEVADEFNIEDYRKQTENEQE